MIPIVVINLDGRPERWRFQQWQARVHRISVCRFRASTAEEGRDAFPASDIADGACGLWLSNLRLAEALACRPGLTLVLEDDALLSPWFRPRLRKIVATFPPDAWAVQAGYLTDSSIRRQKSLVENVKKILRPRSRVREFLYGPKIPLSELRAGTQAMVVRNESFREMLVTCGIGSKPLDRAYQEVARTFPGRLLRARRSIATQVPSRSDIPWTGRSV